MEKRYCGGGDQRSLFGGLGEDTIPRDQSRGDLPEKDRQGKVPRADAEKYTAPMTMEAIVFSRRSSQRT